MSGKSRKPRGLRQQLARQLGPCWKQLVAADVCYKVLAFVVLTPLLGLLFRGLLAVYGQESLADEELLGFFLGPIGWSCLIAVGTLWLVIVALEQAALLGILAGSAIGHRPRVAGALKFAFRHGGVVTSATARVIVRMLIAAIPFLAAVGVIYLVWLTEFDINYYLTEKPPIFWRAAGLAAVLVVAMLGLWAWLIAGWFFALPIILFEGEGAGRSLKVSAERARGQRLPIWRAILLWGIASLVLSSVAAALVTGLGSWLVPRFSQSPQWLVFFVGFIVLLWGAINLAVNLLYTITFAVMMATAYGTRGRGKVDLARLAVLKAESEGEGFRITRTRLIAAGIIGVVLALLAGVTIARSIRLQDDVQIIAHRGASAGAPENTLAAVRLAVEQGTDWVEIDVQQTSDERVVVLHDQDFMKLSGQPDKIWDLTWEATRDERFDIGSWFAPEFSDQRVPLLSEVLALCRDRAGVTIELKYYGVRKELEERLAERVIEIVEREGMADQVVVMSLKGEAVKQMKALRPQWKVGRLAAVAAGELARSPADFLAVNAGMADRAFVRSSHQHGKQVLVWTVNDWLAMSTMIGRGVDGLITDKPDLARQVLADREQLGPAERLMLQVADLLGIEPQGSEQ